MMQRSTLAFALAATLLSMTGCGGGDSAPTVQVFRYRGSLQCLGGGSSIDGLRRQLVDAGIEASAGACGTDGKVYPAACGTPDGAIGVFEIPLAQVEAAAALLFAPLATLDAARVVPCP